MAIVPLFGHQELQARLLDALTRNALPASLLFHGPRGVGKQRLAVWLAQVLLCESVDKPCGECRGCRFALDLKHPDLHWYFPRPRLKDSDADLEDVREDYGEAIADRARDGGLYPPSQGSDGIYVATVRAIVREAVVSPALGRRKVFIIGDAERMVPQEGSEFAANAFLKLLEEPPDDTTLVLTSSEPGALLPTIRSRVASIRVAPVASDDVRAFLANHQVAERLKGDDDLPASPAERVVFAGGAPGRLLAGAMWSQAVDNARRLLESATGSPAARFEAAWSQAASRARGSFADTLDALTVELHDRAKSSARRGATKAALGASQAIELVEVAKERVGTNASPQLIAVNLMRELRELLT